MSSQYRPHFGGDPRVLEAPGGQKATRLDGNTVPTDASAGYEHGCTFRKHNGTTGADALYVNVGSVTSCNFDLVQTTTDGVALLATAAEINRAADVSTRGVVLAGSTTITEALHEGKVCIMTGTGAAFTQTLPSATGSGARYTFVVGAVNTSNHVITSSSASFTGNIWSNSTVANPDLGQPWPSSNSTIITLNGTTKGGQQIGDKIEFIDILTDVYMVLGHTTSSGVIVTPFS